MSIGSAFDAYVKCYIHRRIYGNLHPNSDQFEFDTLFTKQVESHNRDWALNAGAHAFRAYKNCGALGDLMSMLEKASSPPQMEFTGVKEEGRTVIDAEYPKSASVGLRLLGIPDLAFATEGNIKVIHDWKVNGYCSRSGISPVPGYINLMPEMKQHKDCVPWFEGDIQINSINNIEEQKYDWALQLSTYAWICGEPVGSEIIVSVDQLACKPHMPDAPKISVAQHRCNISSSFQHTAYTEYLDCWEVVHSEHIFRDLSLDDSKSRCDQLENQADAFKGKEAKHEWLRSITGRGH